MSIMKTTTKTTDAARKINKALNRRSIYCPTEARANGVRVMGMGSRSYCTVVDMAVKRGWKLSNEQRRAIDDTRSITITIR